MMKKNLYVKFFHKIDFLDGLMDPLLNKPTFINGHLHHIYFFSHNLLIYI